MRRTESPPLPHPIPPQNPLGPNKKSPNPCRFCTSKKHACNPFIICTSKTKDLKPRRINTYRKTRGVGVILLTRYPTKGICPERPTGAKDLPYSNAACSNPAGERPSGAKDLTNKPNCHPSASERQTGTEGSLLLPRPSRALLRQSPPRVTSHEPRVTPRHFCLSLQCAIFILPGETPSYICMTPAPQVFTHHKSHSARGTSDETVL